MLETFWCRLWLAMPGVRSKTMRRYVKLLTLCFIMLAIPLKGMAVG